MSGITSSLHPAGPASQISQLQGVKLAVIVRPCILSTYGLNTQYSVLSSRSQISNYQTLTESVGATQDHRTSCLGRLVKDFLVSDQLHLHTDIGGKLTLGLAEPGWGWVV